MSAGKPLFGRAAAFAASVDGVAAVEFAMVLPLLVVLYLGMAEITYAVNADHRVTLLGRTLADLTGRQTKVTATTMDGIFGAAFAVMQPYKADDPTSPMTMVVSSVAVTDTGTASGGAASGVLQGKVCWSEARKAVSGALTTSGATALTAGTVVTVPTGFQNAGTSYIRADVTLNYKPIFGSSVLKYFTNNGTSAITFSQKTPWPVRNGTEVIMTGVTGCVS